MSRVIEMHKLEDLTHFEQLREETAGFIQNVLRSSTKETSDHQMAFHELLLLSYKEGCIGFILGKTDEHVRESFRRAADYGIKLLAAKAPDGSTGFRSFEVDLEAARDGSIGGVEIRERRFQPEERKLSVDKFVAARMAITAFGPSSELMRVGYFPEEDYANPNVVPEPGTLEDLRARKAWLRGDRIQAKREGEAALSRSSNARVRPSIQAFLSLIGGDFANFCSHLVDVVKQHAKFYKKYPHVAEGAICYPGMELGRMAFDQGFPLKEQPYLPLRFLPNFSVS